MHAYELGEEERGGLKMMRRSKRRGDRGASAAVVGCELLCNVGIKI